MLSCTRSSYKPSLFSMLASVVILNSFKRSTTFLKMTVFLFSKSQVFVLTGNMKTLFGENLSVQTLDCRTDQIY